MKSLKEEFSVKHTVLQNVYFVSNHPSVNPSFIHSFLFICPFSHLSINPLFNYPSIHPSIHYLFTNPSVNSSFIHSSIHNPYINPFIHASTYLFIHPSINQFIRLSTHLSVHPPTSLATHPPIPLTHPSIYGSSILSPVPTIDSSHHSTQQSNSSTHKFILLSHHPSIHPPIQPLIHLIIQDLSIHSIHPSINTLFSYQSIHQPNYSPPSIHASTPLFIHLFIHLTPIYLSIHPSIHPSTDLTNPNIKTTVSL